MLFRRLTARLIVGALGFASATAAAETGESALPVHATADTPALRTDATVAPAETAAVHTASALAQTAVAVAHTFQGMVSYYGREFIGRKTASGERFDPGIPTMAHKTLAFGTLVRVTNLHNNRSVVVRVNDRGPFIASRVGDLSPVAANLLGMLNAGVVFARLEVLGSALSQAFKP